MMTKKINPLLDSEKQTGITISITIALICAAFLVFKVNWMHTYEFDPDEGYNVIKALMLEDGFKLYSEILSDQPPGFTYILWLTFKVFGWDINVGRMVVIAFVSLMIFGIYDSVRRLYGVPAALGAIVFLTLSYKFTWVSVFIMLGQPSLSMAIMSCWGLVLWYTQRRTSFLLVSGAFLGISISIKMFTLFIAPIALLCIILFGKNLPYRKTRKLILNQLTLWLMGFFVSGLFFLSPALFSHVPASAQLITAHTNPLVEVDHTLGKTLWKFIVNNWMLMLMSAIGCIYAIKNRNLVGVFFGLWLAFASVILFFHHPVWYHHAFLLLMPASVMAGLSACWMTDALMEKGWDKRSASMLAIVSIVLIAVLSPKISGRRPWELAHPWEYSNNNADQLATEIISYYAGPERTMITSRQMFAFKTKSSVPPHLAVTSNKRFRAGLWSAKTIIEDIEKENIEQVVLNDRWKSFVRKEIKEAIQAKYTRVYGDKKNRKLEIFVRKDIAVKKLPFEKGID